jgi:hypothetical protein
MRQTGLTTIFSVTYFEVSPTILCSLVTINDCALVLHLDLLLIPSFFVTCREKRVRCCVQSAHAGGYRSVALASSCTAEQLTSHAPLHRRRPRGLKRNRDEMPSVRLRIQRITLRLVDVRLPVVILTRTGSFVEHERHEHVLDHLLL